MPVSLKISSPIRVMKRRVVGCQVQRMSPMKSSPIVIVLLSLHMASTILAQQPAGAPTPSTSNASMAAQVVLEVGTPCMLA